MATKKIIREMITFFSSFPLKNKPRDEEATVLAYEKALYRYRDEQVIKAAPYCVEEMTYYPTPKDIIDRIHAIAPNESAAGFRFVEAGPCSKCGQYRPRAIDDRRPNPLCEECFTGISKEEKQMRVKELNLMLERIGKTYEEAA